MIAPAVASVLYSRKSSSSNHYNQVQKSVKIGQGVIIGLAIGIPTLVIISLIISICCIIRVRRRRRAIAQSSTAPPGPPTGFHDSGGGVHATLGGSTYGASPYGANSYGANPYSTAPHPASHPALPLPTPQPAPQPTSVYDQQQAAFAQYTRAPTPPSPSHRSTDEARCPLLAPEPAHVVSHGTGASAGALEVPPPAYETASAETSPAPSPAPSPRVEVEPVGEGERRMQGGREVRRDSKNRGTVLEYERH